MYYCLPFYFAEPPTKADRVEETETQQSRLIKIDFTRALVVVVAGDGAFLKLGPCEDTFRIL